MIEGDDDLNETPPPLPPKFSIPLLLLLAVFLAMLALGAAHEARRADQSGPSLPGRAA